MADEMPVAKYAHCITLLGKLHKVMKAIDAIPKKKSKEKDSKITYMFLHAEDMFEAVHDKFVEFGVIIKPDVLSSSRWDKQTQSGGTLFFCEVHARFELICTDTGQCLDMSQEGWGMDTGDKAPQKAMTYALKYGLRNLFLVPDGTASDGDHVDAGDYDRAQKKGRTSRDVGSAKPGAANRGHDNEGTQKARQPAPVKTLTTGIAFTEEKASGNGTAFMLVKTKAEKTLYCTTRALFAALARNPQVIAVKVQEQIGADQKFYLVIVDIVSVAGQPYKDGMPATQANAGPPGEGFALTSEQVGFK